jgi:hypothetical protein
MQQEGKKEEEKNLIKNIKINIKLIIIQKNKKMNLKELKSMIAEEYRYWMAEQPVDMGAPGAPGAPGVEVGPDDIDVMGGGGDDSEATLRQIYDMLKAYFEGGAEAPSGPPAGGEGGEDIADMTDMDAGGDEDMVDDEDDDEEEDEDEEVSEKESKKESKKELQERFQKLANIIKG